MNKRRDKKREGRRQREIKQKSMIFLTRAWLITRIIVTISFYHSFFFFYGRERKLPTRFVDIVERMNSHLSIDLVFLYWIHVSRVFSPSLPLSFSICLSIFLFLLFFSSIRVHSYKSFSLESVDDYEGLYIAGKLIRDLFHSLIWRWWHLSHTNWISNISNLMLSVSIPPFFLQFRGSQLVRGGERVMTGGRGERESLVTNINRSGVQI